MTMSKQDVFDTVVTHLYQQGCRAMGSTMCQYLDSEGRQCAVGCLIDKEDNRYENILEFQGDIDKLIERFGDSLPEEVRTHRFLLARLQEVHDMNYCTSLETNLRIIAQRAYLKYREEFYPLPPETWQ